MPNDTRTIDLVINNLTEEQFENVFSPDPNELWVTPDDTPEKLAEKVDKTSDPNKTYGTDAQGNQITYSTPTIPTVNNPTITITQGGVTKGSFSLNQATGDTIALDAGGGGIGNIDNLTITANADDEIQAVAVIDQNTGIAKTWTGTMAEYEAIVTKDPETEYIITDDIGGSATEIGQITEALNNKVDKGHQVIEFQEPTAANNYTWYRKYADGWVEQGGYMPGQNSGWGSATITLPVPMASRYYYISRDGNWSDASSSSCTITTMTATAFSLTYASNTMDVYGTMWEVKGMAA